ncbi:hypothetical protein MYCTH_50523 [Thermothelomyces thermophilus ATCC 42464]|uniref:Deacetylase sirtuin-type domain-containing protein n=1 Tax=Thermothelomyces thermophilus (strain ATCC 42464 / BCRC 31852 / DSM 1799) TaxID=573729 RepID=G2QDD8_THET4|nr:uncharacterized protein MYCTH_50523 [Thermothelomyces thermophilus ATCC 42464]AEO58303.1 hypothetical protein MYCTH_50523 [Thermothelomyces thermophilus ATCC 42464]
MPTTYVAPGCDPLLQDIANTLWKSRKVVVITGAGISTNSGIPDFRSENGLYSLIQAQFDAAQQQATENNGDAGGQDAEQRPAKRQRKTLDDPELGRRRASRDHGLPFPGLRGATEKSNDTRTDQNTENTDSPDSKANRLADAQHPNPENAPCPSSPPSFVLGTPHPRRAHLLETLPGSSSPLSSPPPIMYDPYQETTSCSSDRGTESSRSQSEEPSSATTPLLSSQTSITSRTSLPSMKGRDLFDAQIWSCPIKTSVFYTFVSTLREKVRNAEPTISHRFVSVLRDSRKLVRCYTQNIDQLEERVGLSTSLSLGAGSRYRFSTRAGRNSGAAKGQARGADGAPEANQAASQKDEDQERSRTTQPDSTNVQDEGSPPASQQTVPAAPNRGVECVFLHGSLAELRCFVCARTASWEEDDRLEDTLAGRQPTCPHCAGATAAREEKGKRALGVGKLRPDIVLYGEEHPHAHLISPLVQHDLSLGPDMLLILGTSMRVHGLKAQAAIPASSPVSKALPSDTLSGNNGNSSISAAVKSRRRKQAVAWRIIGGVETRVTLNNTAEPQMPVASSLPRSQAVLRPSPVPHHRRLPPPTPTTPKPTPPYQPNNTQSHIPRPQPITAAPPASAIDMAINAGFRETDRLIAQVHHETLLSRPATPSQLRLPPLLAANLPDQRHRPGQSNDNNYNSQQQHIWEQQQQHNYPTTKLVPLEPKVDSPGPRQAISSNVGSPVACASAGRNPFFLSDPLAGWLGYPPVWLHHHPPHHLHPHHPHQKFRTDMPPQQQRRDYGGNNYDGSDGRSGATDDRKCSRVADTDSGTGSDAKREQQRETEASSPWCPNEQLRKEQEAALMLSAMRGTGEYR